VVKRALRFLTKSEFESVVSDWDKLKALGIIKGGNTAFHT